MDADSQQRLARLLRDQRTASLGTLREGAPLASLALFAAAPDFTALYLHLSRLAQHTQDLRRDPRVSLMIAEADTGAQDPQTLARVSIRGEAVEIPPTAPAYETASAIYRRKFPTAAEFNFQLGDFAFYQVQPHAARYVAGFGKTFNLTLEDFRQLAASAAPQTPSTS
jgi:hypothetical protein